MQIILRSSGFLSNSSLRMQSGWNYSRPPSCSHRVLPRIIYTRKRIFRYYSGFSFFLFIWISKVEKDQRRLILHERIHFLQQVELLFIFHWLLYALFYLISRAYGQGHYIAYRYNPFELEAYKNDRQETYLTSRKPFAWVSEVRHFWKGLGTNIRHQEPTGKEINF